MFAINMGKGFQLTFSNGYRFSVQFGPGNYCSQREEDILDYALHGKNHCESETAEIAIIDSEGVFVPLLSDDVAGYVSADKVGEIAGELSKESPNFSNIRAILRR